MILESIDTDTLVGLRDRALIAVMVYTFARIGAAVSLRIEGVFTQERGFACVCTRRAASDTRSPAITP